MKGRKHTQAVRDAMSIRQLGRKWPPRTVEQRKRMSIAATGKIYPLGAKNKFAKCYLITHIETGTKHFVKGISEFCRQNGLNQGSLSCLARGNYSRGKQHHGYTAEEITEVKYNRLKGVQDALA